MRLSTASRDPQGRPTRDVVRLAERVLTPGGLLLTLISVYFLIKIPIVIEVTILAVMYATIIESPVRQLERRRVPRRVAIVAINAIAVLGIIVPALLAAPAVDREVHNFQRDEPAKLRTLDAQWATSSNALLRGPGRTAIQKAIPLIEHPKLPAQVPYVAAMGAVLAVVGLAALFAIAYYYLMEKEWMRRALLESVDVANRAKTERIWDNIEHAIGEWLRGRLILGAAVGVMTLVFFWFLHLPYWTLLALLAGLSEPIPIIGPWIGGVPAGFLAFTQSWEKMVIVVVFVLVRQTFVDSVLVPRITKETLGLSPLTVFVAVLIGTALASAIGALLAIPVAAVIEILLRERILARRQEGQQPMPSGWSWLLKNRE